MIKKSISTFLAVIGTGLVIVVIGLGFLFGPTNPIPWILIAILVLSLIVYNWMAKRSTVKWNDSYSVGIEVIDNDHKKLLNLLNKCQTAYQYHTGDEFERQALEELVDYTKTHFDREEGLLEKHGYPDLESHKQEHRDMIAQVGEFQKIYEAQGHKALGEVSRYLEGWLINHINGTDKKYSPFLREKGVR